MKNEFDTEIKYKLFRTVNEILHPTISKRNISDYKIIMDDDILPVRVFYPKKVTDINKVIIYVHGNGKVTDCEGEYSSICKNFATKTNTMLVAVEYNEFKNNYKKILDEVKRCITYLYDKLIINNIDKDSIIVMSDSTGCHIINSIELPVKKEILLYPVLSTKYKKDSYESINKNEDFNIGLIERINEYFKDTLDKDVSIIDNSINKIVLIGNVDSLKDEVCEYYKDKENTKLIEMPFSSHGFIKDMDKELAGEVFTAINKFI